MLTSTDPQRCHGHEARLAEKRAQEDEVANFVRHGVSAAVVARLGRDARGNGGVASSSACAQSTLAYGVRVRLQRKALNPAGGEDRGLCRDGGRRDHARRLRWVCAQRGHAEAPCGTRCPVVLLGSDVWTEHRERTYGVEATIAEGEHSSPPFVHDVALPQAPRRGVTLHRRGRLFGLACHKTLAKGSCRDTAGNCNSPTVTGGGARPEQGSVVTSSQAPVGARETFARTSVFARTSIAAVGTRRPIARSGARRITSSTRTVRATIRVTTAGRRTGRRRRGDEFLWERMDRTVARSSDRRRAFTQSSGDLRR
eukprot:Opistho-1_new@77510